MAKTKKVPKRIAGVKLPKTLRRGLRDLAADQHGRAALAEALGAAGAALAAAEAQPRPTPRQGARKKGAGVASAGPPRGQGADARADAVAALEDAARSFTDTLRRRSPAQPPPPASPTPSASTH
jgi:hypothetical protein